MERWNRASWRANLTTLLPDRVTSITSIFHGMADGQANYDGVTLNGKGAWDA